MRHGAHHGGVTLTRISFSSCHRVDLIHIDALTSAAVQLSFSQGGVMDNQIPLMVVVKNRQGLLVFSSLALLLCALFAVGTRSLLHQEHAGRFVGADGLPYLKTQRQVSMTIRGEKKVQTKYGPPAEQLMDTEVCAGHGLSSPGIYKISVDASAGVPHPGRLHHQPQTRFLPPSHTSRFLPIHLRPNYDTYSVPAFQRVTKHDPA